MISLVEITEIVGLALWSAYVQGERPLSVLLSAPVEAGKTELVMQYNKNDGILYISGFTPTGFMNTYSSELVHGSIRHVLVPDLLSGLAKQYYVRQGLITFLNSLTEEGVASYHTMFVDLNIQSPHPIGLVGGVTKEMLMESRIEWAKVGFLSRMLPVTWNYKGDTVTEIMQYVMRRQYVNEKKTNLDFPDTEQKVNLPYELAEKLKPLADKLVAADKQAKMKTAEDAFGFRYQRHFQRLAMACALSQGRDEVNITDINRVRVLSRFCNLDFTKV